MIFTKKITVYPFSGFEGQLFYNGKPAAFAKVKRTYDWDDTLHEEEVTADEQGRFRFESVSVEIRESLSQFVSSQEVFVSYEEQVFNIWSCGKIAKEEFGEFGGKPSLLSCDITQEQSAHKLPNGYVGSSCHWQSNGINYQPEQENQHNQTSLSNNLTN